MDGLEDARTFDVTGSAYDSFKGRYSLPLAELFADEAGVTPGDTAVDVGCGPGALTGVLAHRLGAASVQACDPSPSFCEVRSPLPRSRREARASGGDPLRRTRPTARSRNWCRTSSATPTTQCGSWRGSFAQAGRSQRASGTSTRAWRCCAHSGTPRSASIPAHPTRPGRSGSGGRARSRVCSRRHGSRKSRSRRWRWRRPTRRSMSSGTRSWPGSVPPARLVHPVGFARFVHARSCRPLRGRPGRGPTRRRRVHGRRRTRPNVPATRTFLEGQEPWTEVGPDTDGQRP